MKGVHWIDSGQWPPAIAIVGDRRAYQAFMRKHCPPGNASAFPLPNAGRVEKLVDHDNGTVIFLIVIGEQASIIETASCIAHEATHVMRWLFEHINERSPGLEAQAYLVEHIVRHGLKALAA